MGKVYDWLLVDEIENQQQRSKLLGFLGFWCCSVFAFWDGNWEEEEEMAQAANTFTVIEIGEREHK